jgi:hypothetical protein
MTRADAHLLNTIREIMGKAPIPDIGRDAGERRPARSRVDDGDHRVITDFRFLQNLAQFEGDGNRRTPRKAGAL